MPNAFAGKIHHRLWRFAFSCLFIGVFSGLFAEQITDQDSESHFYNRLRSEDFMRMMIPKEKYLLGLVKNVSEELANRRSEGQTAIDLGIDAIRSPKDVLMDNYSSEVKAMERLITQIENLEIQAKRRVDLDILRSLEQLKERLKSFLSDEIKSLSVQHEKQASQMQHQPIIVPGASNESPSFENVEDPFSEEAITSGDLFEQWKYNRILDYKLRLAKYNFYRLRLRNSANAAQAKRIFQRDLQQALQTYNAGDFELARFQLQDVLDQYSETYVLDDVMYFRCESAYALNLLNEAIEGYQRLTATYPNSEYASKAMVKMIYIYYIYGDVNKQVDVFQRLLIRRLQIFPGTWGTLTYLVGYSQFKSGQFKPALETLNYINTGSSYYYPAHYLSAACYSNLGDNDKAIQIYKRLVNEISATKNPMLNQIRNNALLKLGLIYYENGKTRQAREYFSLVAEESESYDLSLLGDAWAAYQEGRPAEALKSVESLLNDNLLSNYMYEARVLAASSKELLGRKEAALSDLKQITGVERNEYGEQLNAQRDGFNSLNSEKERELYKEAKQIQKFLRGDPDIMRFNQATETEFLGTQQQLQQEINTLDHLESLAREDQKKGASLSDIRQLRGEVIETLQDHTMDGRGATASRDDAPLIRQMGMTEYLRYLFRSLLLETMSEKDHTKMNIESAEQLMADAQAASRFKISLHMEMRIEELKDYYDKLSQYEVWLRENLPQEFRIEVDQWTSFSSYGISNINFNRIKEIDERTAQISRVLNSIDRVFKEKRIKLEKRIQRLLSDVSRIEGQMKVEAKRRKERDREDFFHNKYFNKQVKEPAVQK
ncbi:tetratricopeptide repeat protein [bacterium]|nr:tetratricopeptide repeat protein [bacterium]